MLNARQQNNNQVQRTFDNVVKEYRVNNHDPNLHIDDFLNEESEGVNNILSNSLTQFTSFKVQAVVCTNV